MKQFENDLYHRVCGVMVAHAPWEGGEPFESDIFDHYFFIKETKQ